ncbi:Hypothetical protein A7982_06698 [Minicystis rosea]|nr:Hypothetical protein A7982_06698 [Minicystis rosea]
METIPTQEHAGEVWIDGQWEWDGKSWKWLSGRWMTPPAGAYFTPWETERRPDGRLFFARATWRSRDGRPIDLGFGHEACPPGASPRPTGEVARP